MSEKKTSWVQWLIIAAIFGLIIKGIETCYYAVFPKSETEIMEDWLDGEMKRHGY